MEEREQSVLLRSDQERPELGYGPYGAGLLGLRSWPLGPLHRVAADEFVHDDGIAECLPEHRVQVSPGRDGKRLAIAPSVREQVTVELGDGGRPDGLDRQGSDVLRGVEPDAGPEPGRVLAVVVGHQAAVLSASNLETYSSREVSGMRRDPSMRIEAMAPLASSS